MSSEYSRMILGGRFAGSAAQAKATENNASKGVRRMAEV
jgi:hypothetical protein